MVAKWVGLRCMSLTSVCKESFSVWVKGGNTWSLRSNTKQKNNDLAGVCVCLPCFFNCEWVCCGFGVLTVCHGVWCVSLCGCKVALVGGVRLRVCRLGSAGCSSVEVCGW